MQALDQAFLHEPFSCVWREQKLQHYSGGRLWDVVVEGGWPTDVEAVDDDVGEWRLWTEARGLEPAVGVCPQGGNEFPVAASVSSRGFVRQLVEVEGLRGDLQEHPWQRRLGGPHEVGDDVSHLPARTEAGGRPLCFAHAVEVVGQTSAFGGRH